MSIIHNPITLNSRLRQDGRPTDLIKVVCTPRPKHDLRDQIQQLDLVLQFLRYLLRISHEILLISYVKNVVYLLIKNTLQIQLFKTTSSHVDSHLKSGRKLRTIIFLSVG